MASPSESKVGTAIDQLDRRRILRGAASMLGLSTVGIKSQARLHAQDIALNPDQWIDFKSRFITEGGRVVDTGNHGISHSEGQGWALYAAVCFHDELTFDGLLSWTTRELQRNTDSLHAWRYVPGTPMPVSDRNNATDGDLFIAAALARAAKRWKRPNLERQAATIAHDILRLLVTKVGARTVLLPGVSGFEPRPGVILNPSYYVFPVFAELGQLVPSPLWSDLQRDAMELLSEGRFGRWMLPPDWLTVSATGNTLAPAAGWAPRFSYDAIRVPLFLSWAGLTSASITGAFHDYWTSFPTDPPAWVNLITGDVAPYAAPVGMCDVADFSIGRQPMIGTGDNRRAVADYYSAGLSLLTSIAREETKRN